MPHFRAVVGFGLIGLLAACQQMQGIPGMPGGTQTAGLDDGCGAAARQDLVGENVAVLNTADLPEGRRILFPGMMATQDFQPGRLNVEVDSSDTITRVYCG
jgi:Peptidase inhibitor I78 family